MYKNDEEVIQFNAAGSYLRILISQDVYAM